MQDRPTHARTWTAALARAAALAVCLFALQQCSTPTGGSPTGPGNTGNQPPTTTPPTTTPPGPQTFVGAGDIALCGNGQQEATARLIDGIGGTVFTLGDNAYMNGTSEEFRNCYDSAWGRFKDRTRPSPGNHDYGQPGAAAYFAYYGDRAGPAGLGYYSFNLGGWHILSLNSDITAWPGSQEAWVRQDLAANANTRCTLAYWHYPAFSSGPNPKYPHARDMFRIMYDHNVDLVLVGHDHLYERFDPQDPDGRPDTTKGIREIVVGSGGMVPLYDFLAVQPNSRRREKQHGVLKLTLSADSYSWEFINVGNTVVDSGGPEACH